MLRKCMQPLGMHVCLHVVSVSLLCAVSCTRAPVDAAVWPRSCFQLGPMPRGECHEPQQGVSQAVASAEEVWPLQVVKRGENEQTVTASLDAAVDGQTHLTSLSSDDLQ